MPTIRTTMRPDLDLDVDDREYADLKIQGLVAEVVAPRPAPAPSARRSASQEA